MGWLWVGKLVGMVRVRRLVGMVKGQVVSWDGYGLEG